MNRTARISFIGIFLVLTRVISILAIDSRHVWGYECHDNRCVKVQITAENEESIESLERCHLNCYPDIGTLWPKPSGNVVFSRDVTMMNINSINFVTTNLSHVYWTMAVNRFHEMQQKKIPLKYPVKGGGKRINISVVVDNDDTTLDYDTYEGYNLNVSDEDIAVQVRITAPNFYGARHALETLSQLIIHDELNNELLIMSSASIQDEPKFRHRGISMDTSRNYYTVDVIKKTINGLAMTKLNTFHWHITDAQSFPLEIKSHMDLTKYGAYSAKKIYTATDIKDIVEFGKSRGVKVIPELDAPAHIGEGWQKKVHLTTCFEYRNAQQLTYCYQRPCGHLDPTKAELYDVLEDIYREMMESFNPPAFHMGGDEIFFSCWNSSESLRQWMLDEGWTLHEEDFLRLWGYFQEKALERLDKVSGKKVPIILWTSELTEEPYVSAFLDKERYIIQIWTEWDDPIIKELLEKGYRLIITNNDALYLDCVTNWCAPYHEWQTIYDNKMDVIAGSNEAYTKLIYGAEAAIWSERIDETNLDSRIFPRVSAMAERLWSDPQEHWRNAEPRLLFHRNQLVTIGGLTAQGLQMEWCKHNEGMCQL